MSVFKNLAPYAGILVAGLIIGVLMGSSFSEGFADAMGPGCNLCGRGRRECGCSGPEDRNKCPQIDWSKYVLKASVPACPPQPENSFTVAEYAEPLHVEDRVSRASRHEPLCSQVGRSRLPALHQHLQQAVQDRRVPAVPQTPLPRCDLP